MPETDYRINLWRNTIQLFHEIRRPHFVGPFKAAGLNYVVDRPFLTTQGNEQRPDIVASGEGGWLILELTANQKSKKIQFDKYRMIDPRYLASYGLHPHENKPDIMSSRLTHIDDGSYCQILVKDFLVLKNEENLDNQYLKDELIKAKGIDLRKLPEIPITLVPEMVKYHLEIRRGLIEIIMQLFAPDSIGKTPVQMVEEGLDKLSDKIGVTEKHNLIERIKSEMDVLMGGNLSGYIEFKDNTYRATDKFKQHHKTLENIASKLKEWASPTPQKQLIDF